MTHPRTSTPSDADLDALFAARVGWIHHRGLDILREDYSGCTEVQVVGLVKRLTPFVLDSGRDGINELVIIRDLKVTRSMLDATTAAGDAFDHLVARTCVVGVRGAQNLILKLYNTFARSKMHPFPTEVAAMDWMWDRTSSATRAT